MAQPEIVRKLNDLLSLHIPFSEESQIVYFLVEVRKVLDRDNNNNYPLLRFYCDWSVHTEKDRITPEIWNIMTDIYADVADQILSYPMPPTRKIKIIGFTHMEDLELEMQNFLRGYGLPDALTAGKDNWLSFVKLLVGVLADQPIIKPCPEIQKFAFVPAHPGCVLGRIDFTNPINGYDHYKFGDTY